MDKWGIVSGNWGDVMCDLAHYKKNIGEGNVIYYGNAQGMKEFLECQDFIHQVVVVEGRKQNDNTYNDLSSVRTWHDAAQRIIKHTDVDPSKLVYASRNYIDFHTGLIDPKELNDVPIIENLNLPQKYRDWAADFTVKLAGNKEFFMLQPVSVNTNSISEHWPYWGLYLSWMIHDSSKRYILVGQGWNSHLFSKLRNVTNLVDKTPNIMNVFALAELSKGVITTSNSLAHWCRAQNLNTLICAPVYSTGVKQYFRETVLGPTVSFFDYGAKPEVVYYKTYEKFGIFSAGDKVEMMDLEELIK